MKKPAVGSLWLKDGCYPRRVTSVVMKGDPDTLEMMVEYRTNNTWSICKLASWNRWAKGAVQSPREVSQ